MRKIALFSLNNTSKAVDFAEQLIKAGWDILASKETVVLLREKNLPVEDIADFTGVKEDYGFPPTLSAKVEYALTNNNAEKRIDLVYVIPYPLSVGNDVGGRTLLALAVKGGRLAVMSIEDMEKIVAELKDSKDISESWRRELADKACYEIAKHYLSLIKDKDKYDYVLGKFSYNLLNGENPYQVPASVFVCENNSDRLSLLNFKKVSGQVPCFTNVADADCILNTICLVAQSFQVNFGVVPYICVAAKHGNPCGMAISNNSQEEAMEKALFGNPRSIWGGEVITNFPINEKLAKILLKSEKRGKILGDKIWMLDVIVAPSFSKEAVLILGKRKARKLLENEALSEPVLEKDGLFFRKIRGGFIRQPIANYILNFNECQTDNNLSEIERTSLIVAWATVFSSNHGGNEVAIAKDGVLLGAGGGPSTVEAAQIAISRVRDNQHEITGAAFAADAFFPFTDAPRILIDAGVKLGSVPGGGVNESVVKDFFKKDNIKMIYIPEQYRGFCRH